jgi:hypothetical protein
MAPEQLRSGINDFKKKQTLPSAYSLNTGQASKGELKNMQQNYNELLPPSLQRSTPVGRSRNSPDRIAERELRVRSRLMDRALSPFAQSNMQSRGISQPQQMARNSIFGAMQPAPFANPAMPAMPQTPILGPTFTTYR